MASCFVALLPPRSAGPRRLTVAVVGRLASHPFPEASVLSNDWFPEVPVKVLALLLMMFAPMAHAFDYDLTCVTNPPTTSFGIWTEGEEMVVRVLHHHGSRFAPAFTGVYTPNDVSYLAEVAKLVQKMPAITTFRWPRKNCSLNGAVLKCFGTEDVQEGEGGAKLKPFGVHTSRTKVESIAGTNEYTHVSVVFDVDGKSGPRLEMPFPEGECSHGANASKLGF